MTISARHDSKQRAYIAKHRSELEEIPFLSAQDQNFGGVSLFDYLAEIVTQKPKLLELIDITKRPPSEWRNIYMALASTDDGGFDHGASGHNSTTGLQYGVLQKDPAFNTARIAGFKGLWDMLQPVGEKFSNKDFFLDALAGNGTFERVLGRLVHDQYPTFINHDISSELVRQAIESGQHAVRGFVHQSFLKNGSIAGAVSAYGTHHIPPQDRQDYVNGIRKLLKPNGAKYGLQDFETGTPTANFYAQLIDETRPGGHKYDHFTPDQMTHLLSTAGFKNVATTNIYDPYVLEGKKGQTEDELKRWFNAYLIKLFTLEKLLPEYSNGNKVGYSELADYENKDYWRGVADRLKPYHTFPDGEITGQYGPMSIDLKMDDQIYSRKIPVVDSPQIFQVADDQLSIVVPRLALVAVGETPEKTVNRTPLK